MGEYALARAPDPARPVGLLFDKDGTLLDFALTWERAVPAILARVADGDAARIARAADAIGFDVAAGRFRSGALFIAGSTSDYGPPLAKALGVAFDDHLARRFDLACEAEGAVTLTAVCDLVPLFEDLVSRGHRLGIATNDSEASARRQMTALGLDRHLSYVAGYDSGHGAKPAPGMVAAFATQLGVEPGRIAMIGDSVHDLSAGRHAGAMTIAVLTGAQGPAELQPLADHVLASVEGLPRLLDSLASRSPDR